MIKKLWSVLTCAVIGVGLFSGQAQEAGQSREQKVRADRQKVEADGYWIYNDLPRGFAEAKRTGKPMLVVLRCIPCVECVKLDDDLVNEDRRVRPLLDQLVRVRVVSTNGLDLAQFQFDTDQSFAAFLLNADGTVYGRFGTRSHRTYWSDDVSIEGLAKALQGALELHQQYPMNQAALAGKRGQAPEVPSPEQLPTLREPHSGNRYGSKLNYEGNVVQSCIHCHQIGDARRQLLRDRRQPMPAQVLFPFPHPKSIGLILDPKEKATVVRVENGSPAEAAGFLAGDEVKMLDRQPMLSIADVQWVLHQSPADGATVKAEVKRGGRVEGLTLSLPKGWKAHDDISWRASTWGLRRMAAGGLVLEDLPPEDRRDKARETGAMALRVKYVGQGAGPHGTAQRAGFRKGDVLISFDGRTDLKRETDLLTYAVNAHKPGEQVAVKIVRDGKAIELMLPMQE
jgi:hypothetical protein